MMKDGRLDKDVSVGSSCNKTGNKGLCELLIYKFALKSSNGKPLSVPPTS